MNSQVILESEKIALHEDQYTYFVIHRLNLPFFLFLNRAVYNIM